MAAAARGGEPKAFETALQALEAKQLALGQVSRDYKDHLRVRTANLDEVRAALPTETVLIEFRQFRPFDFRTGTFGEPRLAALLLAGFDEPVLADLGPMAEVREAPLGAVSSSMQADTAAAALYRRLLVPPFAGAPECLGATGSHSTWAGPGLPAGDKPATTHIVARIVLSAASSGSSARSSSIASSATM